jgi:hypothetical protein
MTNDAQDHMLPDNTPEDLAVDALLRRADRVPPHTELQALESQILARAAFPLAARRRDARNGLADLLAGWARVALPLAAAAALFAVLSLSSIDITVNVADAELHESDPGALLSALESDSSSGLAHYLIATDGDVSVTVDVDPR